MKTKKSRRSMSPWSDADLEAFLDGALEKAGAADVGRALREDAALRARLAEIRSADALMAEALLAPAGEGGAAARRPSWAAIGGVCAAAASVVAAAGLWGAMVWRGSGSSAGGGGASPPIVQESAPPDRDAMQEYDGVPVVLAVRLPARAARSGDAVDEIAAAPAGLGAASVEAELSGALASGDVSKAVLLIDGAGAAAQEGAYRQIGELMRSATVAERVLDSMEPGQQLAACRLWAEDPKLRTVVFPRLALLAERGQVGPELAAVVGALSERDELRPWVRSYGLAAVLTRDGGPRG